MRVKPGTASTTASIAKEIVAESGMLRSSSLYINSKVKLGSFF